MQEAGELAKNTSILMNVSEFEDVGRATDTLISSLQAFKKEGEDVGTFSMRIIDKYNEVGNNYAISTSDLAESLTRSSAALVAANNSIEQSIAMTAAANTTIQDPESVGNALKTVSMRIRGVKTELEEAGEDTEGMVINTAKLQEKIMALTNIDGSGGINILTESGEFKSTYDILLSISKVWKEMSDTDQAALLELVAGKTRGSVVAALFQNGEVLEDAYNSAIGADGSAIDELNTHLNSIQGRIDLFNNSVQTMWMNAVDSEMVKVFVDFGRILIELIDKLNIFRTALAGVFFYLSASKKSNFDLASMLGIHKIDDEFLKGFSAFGNQGLTGLIAKLFKKRFGSKDIVETQTSENLKQNVEKYTKSIEDIDNELENLFLRLSDSGGKLAVARREKELGNFYDGIDDDISRYEQNISNIEGQISKLEAKRDSMQADVVTETKGYQSMLHVLEKVQDVELSIGDESHASEVITNMSKAASNGQVDLANYVSSLDDADIALKAYAASVQDGNYSIAGFNQFITGHNAKLKASGTAAKAAAIGHQLLNAALSFGASLLISAVISGITKLINAEKEAAEAAREAANASEKLREQAKSIDDYKEQIRDLRKELDNNNLSEAEAYDTREKLLSIQDELVEKYGLEKDRINLVTGAINDQIAAIDELSKKESQRWWNNNQKEINKAIEFFEDENAGTKLDSWFESEFFGMNGITNFGGSQRVADIVNEYLNDESNEHVNGTGYTFGQDIFFNGSAEEVKEQFEDFQDYVQEKIKELEGEKIVLETEAQTEETKQKILDLEEDIAQLQDIGEDLGTEWTNWFGEGSTYASNKALMEQIQYNKAITDYYDEYMKILNAENALIEAQASGDQTEIDAALLEMQNATTAAANAAGEDYMKTYFNAMWEGYEKYSKEREFEKAFTDQTTGLKDSVLSALSGLKDMNAKEILQLKDIEPDNSSFVQLTNVANQYGMEIEDLINLLVKLGYVQAGFNEQVESVVKAADAYSTLSASVESLNEAQQYANEVIHDGIALSEDYYNALKEQLSDVTVNEEGFSDAVDENNGRIVKNAALLKKLINQSKNAQKATLNVAKAQAQLEYKNVVNQIKSAISAMSNEYNAYGFVTNATFDNIAAMREQIDTLKQTIQQYALLEVGLSKAANAYTEYEKAKERDEQLSYDDSFLEMLKTIDEGLLKNETGTEAFEYAVKAILSPEAYADMEALDDVNEKVKFIHDYIDGDPIFSKLFYVDNESGELDINADNVREFANMGLANGVFEGDDTGSFTLSKNIKGIEDVAKAYNISEAAALAMLSAMEKVDAKWGNVLTDVMTAPLERDVNNQVDALDNATKAYEDYLKAVMSGDKEFDGATNAQLQANIENANAALQESEKIANKNAQSYTQYMSVLSACRGEIKLTEDEVNALAKSLGFVDENANPTISLNDDGTLQLTDDQLALLLQKLGKLEEPAVMRVQLQYDTISSEIDQLKKYIDEGCQGTITINGVTFANGTSLDGSKTVDNLLAELTASKKQIEFTYGITETSSEKDKSILESYQELAKNGVSFTVTATVDNAKEGLDTVSEAQDKIKEEQKIEISINGANTVEQAIKNAADQLDRITSKVITLTVNVEKNETDNTTPTISGANVNTRSGHTMYALGNARATGSEGLKSAENNSIVGELGPELVCDPIKGKYYTVGENGTEMVNLPRGAIIYNHKQTAELLKNGYTSRGYYTGGLSFASGNAHSGYGIPDYHPNYEDNTSFSNGPSINNSWDDSASTLSDVADSISDASDAADDFKETLDWVEICLEEINEQLDLMNAELENAANYESKNSIIDKIIGVNETKMSNLTAGIKKYADYAAKLLNEVPAQYRDAAQDGAIAISEFVGEADEKTVEAINNYREWAQKVANLKQELEGVKTEIRELSIQKIDNAQTTGDVKATVEDSQTEKLQNAVDLIEESGNIADDDYYLAMMENSNKKVEYLTAARKEMQKEFDDAVKSGALIKGSDEWYENLDKLYQIDSEIAGATKELEEFQNSINDLYWDNFDELINRLEYAQNDTQGLIDLMSDADMFDHSEDRQYMADGEKYWTAEDVKWTDEGLATMGLYAQQMEIAEAKAQHYAQAIEDLNKDYADGKYSESEYLEKMDELTSGQYDAIESYQDAQNAIKDLNSEMIEMVKEGIEKQIDAYSELADKRKEALDAEKEAYDWQKSISKQQKSISDIDRQLAAIAGDNSMTATAKRRRLEAERAELQEELDDMYYEKSIQNQKDAIDSEVETFTKSKEEEIKKWDEYLENVDQLIVDSLNLIQENASGVYDTLSSKASEYNLTVSDAIISPWKNGETAISDYQSVFGTAVSSTTDQLDLIKQGWREIIDATNEAAEAEVDAINAENAAYAAANKEAPKTEAPKQQNTNGSSASSSGSKSVSIGSTINASGATIYATASGGGANTQYYASDPVYVIVGESGDYWSVRHRSLSSGITGWFKKSDIGAYAKGTTGTNKDQFAWVDELGEELIIRPSGGRMTFLEKGTGVVPADLTYNLMEWGKLDPTIMLDQNRPVISAPHVTNNEVVISLEYGDILHIDNFTGDKPEDLSKMIDKAFDKHMKQLNNQIRRYTR